MFLENVVLCTYQNVPRAKTLLNYVFPWSVKVKKNLHMHCIWQLLKLLIVFAEPLHVTFVILPSWMWFGQHLAASGNSVFTLINNQSLLHTFTRQKYAFDFTVALITDYILENQIACLLTFLLIFFLILRLEDIKLCLFHWWREWQILVNFFIYTIFIFTII